MGILFTVWGIYTVYLLVRDPNSLTETENHPSWKHMYLMMIAAQVGLALAYLGAPASPWDHGRPAGGLSLYLGNDKEVEKFVYGDAVTSQQPAVELPAAGAAAGGGGAADTGKKDLLP